jgi:hypothetical protein
MGLYNAVKKISIIDKKRQMQKAYSGAVAICITQIPATAIAMQTVLLTLPDVLPQYHIYSGQFLLCLKIQVFWDVTLFLLGLLDHHKEGTTMIQNIRSCSPSDILSHPRRLWASPTLL